MKKILFTMLIGLISASFAGNLISTSSPFDSKVEVATVTKDTLTASDSQVIVTKFVPEQKGFYYYITNNNFTGTGADSVVMCIYSDEYTYNDSLMGRIFVDSLKTAYNMKSILLPVHNGLPGSKHTLKAVTVTGSGAQIITNGWNITRCKPFK
jgi:hypothetical protein